MAQKLTIFCYSFVAGVAAAMIIHSGAIPLATVMALWTLSGVAGVLYILFKKTKYSIPLLILTPAFFAAANYYRAVDTSDKNHISHYTDEKFFDRTIITGTVVREPDARDNSTKLTIKPELIEKPSKSGWGVIKSSAVITGKTGFVLVTIYPTIGEFYDTVEYGDKIKVDAALLPPSEMRNPAGFDYGRYLKARGVFAVMYARKSEMIQYVGPGDTDWLTRLAIKLKRRFLLVIRKTMLYPESAFLGGVTLGSRGGVPQKVKMEFQATGVGHVLAVSGLHVGFVHILLLMICNVFRVPKKPRWFILVFGLLLFTIITGASPATKRAALMSSIGQFAYTFGGMGMRMSSAITIPVAAFIILFFDPLMLPDGSFVLSFVAVWSLVHISGPVEDVIRYLFRGWAFLVILIWILFSTGLSIVNPDIFLNKGFSVSYVMLIILTISAAKIINNKYPLKNFDFVSLPKYFVIFTYSQLSIQLGMMIPLSAFFFKMFPVSGIYANYIAIPLIGYIVQLGLIANLFELLFSSLGLATLGLKIAFLINSANYIFSKFFLDMAHFFAIRFPYPFVETPTATEMVLYYVAVMVFILYKPIFYLLEGVYYQVRDIFSIPEVRKKIIYGGAAGFVIVLTLYFTFIPQRKKLKVTFLDAGFGSSIIVQTPQGKNILIDGGSGGGWNFGVSTILPTMSKYKIMKIDRLVLTSPETGNIGGLPSVMEKKPVDEVWDVFDPKKFSLGMTYNEFLTNIGDWKLSLTPYDSRPAQMYADYYEFLKAIENNANPALPKKHYRAKAGDVIYEEKGLKLSVLWPPAEGFQSGEDILDNNSVVLKLVYGKVSFLFTSNIKRDAEWALIDDKSTIRSTVLLAPSHGHKYSSTDEFIREVKPEAVIIQFGYLKGRSFYESDLVPALERYAVCVSSTQSCRTDTSGSVEIISDGEKYNFTTKLGKTGFGISSAQGETGVGEILNIGIQ
ncbi:MAG: ComEC/Rec2 family competence protein [Elusimicrobia bacterium]|nr:ComEC/Rec2 family competence protein [Elusimicrobiota bacterium]